MTYPEVMDEIEMYYRRRRKEIREAKQLRAVMDYQLAQLIGAAFTDTFPRSVKAAYPDLFDDPVSGWKESKAQFAQYAEEFNRQREAKDR